MTRNDLGSQAGDDSAATGRFAYDGLARVFHEKARLSILTSLVAHPRGLVFADLKELCALTDGNLSRHLQAVLHEAGFVEINKGFQRQPAPDPVPPDRRRPTYRFLEYITVLENVVADALDRGQGWTKADPKRGQERRQ